MTFRRALLGLPLLLAPSLAAAAVDCDALADARAISEHYVQPTLDRADAGIAYAATERAVDDFDPFYVSFWSRSIGGTIATAINAKQALAVRSDDFAGTSACLRYDQILLECKLDAVRKALDAELERGSFVAILRLQNLVLFLQERLAHLSMGAADGSYADDRWNDKRLFDQEELPERTEPLCPFHSDYTPPRMTGYGCDRVVLERIIPNMNGYTFVQAEYDALLEIESEIDEFREIVSQMQIGAQGAGGGEFKMVVMIHTETANGGIRDDDFMSDLPRFATTDFPPPVVEIPYIGEAPTTNLSPQANEAVSQINWEAMEQGFEAWKSRYGQQYGNVLIAELQIGERFTDANISDYLSIPSHISAMRDGDTSSPSPPEPLAEREHKTVIGCQEEAGTCSDDSALVCGSDEFCASKGKGECLRNEKSATIPKRSLRGAFSYPVDHLRLLTDFVEKRIEDGFSRTFPVQWAPFAELPEGYSTEERPGDDVIPGSATASTRMNFRSYSGIQGRSEGWIFPEAVDSQLEIADSLSDMRESIGELSRLASQKKGVRVFVVDLAYFLRRTCAFRPCRKSLEQVIRVALEDECFPYTDGAFLKDTVENPRWKTCAMAACIQVDDAEGNPIELPGNCEEILP